MGFFGTKVRHQPMRARDAYIQAFGPARGESPPEWNAWIPKFSLKGERHDCFVGRLVLTDGRAHLLLDGVDYGPVADGATEALDAIRDYGGSECPAVLSITKDGAANYRISVRKR